MLGTKGSWHFESKLEGDFLFWQNISQWRGTILAERHKYMFRPPIWRLRRRPTSRSWRFNWKGWRCGWRIGFGVPLMWYGEWVLEGLRVQGAQGPTFWWKGEWRGDRSYRKWRAWWLSLSVYSTDTHVGESGIEWTRWRVSDAQSHVFHELIT